MAKYHISISLDINSNNGIFHHMQEHYVHTLALHQCLLSLVVGSSNQLKPVWDSLVGMTVMGCVLPFSV